MKKNILILFLLVIGINCQLISQCINEVSTYPDIQPTQNHLNALPQNNGPDERFLNRYHWWFDKDANSNNSIPLNNMGRTVGTYYGTSMKHFNEDSQIPYYHYLTFDFQEVMLPQNGWELLADNRGWYPDNDTEVPMSHSLGEWSSSQDLRSIPYFIFYNKFTGIARIFVRYGNNESPLGSINLAEISLLHPDNDKMSGILRLGDRYDRSLDQFSLIQKVSTIVPSPGDENKWFSCDFQLAFDPCVCFDESQIIATFQFLNEGQLNLHGAGFTVPVNLLESENLFDQDFLGNYDNTNIVDNGYMIYKEMSSMVDDYYKRLKDYQIKLDSVNIHNAKVDENLALLKIAKTVFTTGITAVTGMPNFTSLLGQIPSIKKSDSETFGKETQKAFWKELDKALGMGFDLLMKENFTKKDKPEEPSMPTAAATEMRFSGSVSFSTPLFTSSTINTPGSKNANINGITFDQPQRYPIYNEALGVFALLERPKVRISQTMEDLKCGSLNEYSDYGADFNFNHIVQFRLDEELKYVFNPSLNISESDIEASIFVHCSKKQGDFLDYDFSDNGFNSQNNSKLSVNIETTSFNKDIWYDPIPDDSVVIHSSFVPINAFKNLTSQFSQHFSIKTESLFTEENCLIYENYEYNRDSYSRVEIDSVYLKLLINVTYEGEKSDGSPHEYTYLFTYKIDPEDIHWDLENQIYPNLPGSAGDFTQWSDYLDINGETFNGSQIDGCKLNGNSYLCKAWDNIELSGTLTVANGYTVIIEAGNEINVLPEAVIPPEMTLQIDSTKFDYSNPMPPAADYVHDFCNGLLDNSRYRANSRPGMPTAEGDSILVAESQEETFAFNIFPNPTNGRTTASVTLDESGTGELFITDISGRKLGVVLNNEMMRAGENTYQLPTETLNSGIYLIHLYVNGEHHVKRLVKN